MQHSIVCGVDGSDVARSAARVAARLARDLDLRLVLAHVTQEQPTFPYGDRQRAEIQRRRAIDDGQRLLVDVASGLADVEPEKRVVLGAPVGGLHDLACDEAAALIVVGSRGRGALRAAVLGSVSRALAVTAPLPVVVVPPTAHPPGLVNGGPRRAAHDRAPGLPVNQPARLRGAGGTRRHVGRFSTGLEQLPDTAGKLQMGRFSEGIEQLRPRELRTGRFSVGIEKLPETPSKLRRGSFADGYHAVR